MVLESGGRSFSTSSSGSVDVFLNTGKRHRHHEMLPGDEPTRNEEAIQDTDSMTEASVDVSLGKEPSGIERSKWWKVYAMHFLFMWNSRTYEYVSVS
jgi:hypothetical protein